MKTAEGMARRIASFNSGAVRRAKEAIARGMDLSLGAGLEMEARLVLGGG